MKKFLFVLLISCMMCGYVSAQNVNVIEDELQEVLNLRSDEMIDVVVAFKSQVDVAKLKSKAERNGDKYLQREIVVSELKDFSVRQQKDVMAVLEAEERNGNVANISSLWIVNAISCSASRDVIYQLSLHPDIAAISYNEQVKLIDDAQLNVMESQNLTNSSRGAAPAHHVVTVNADDVWYQGFTGKNVIVAVLDSGTNIFHSDLKDHLWEGEVDGEIVNGWNFSGVNNNSNIIDDYGHGTHCAGIVCGDGTSGKSVTGVAPDASLMTVKIVGSGGTGSVEDMLEGVQFAVEKGAHILSMSLGFKHNQISVAEREMIRGAFDVVLGSGVIVCAAAGNDGNNYGAPYNVDYPAACPSPWHNPDQTLEGGLSSVVCVGAYDLEGMSSQGPSTWEETAYNDYPYTNGESMGLIRPDISAPGKMIYSLNHIQNNELALKQGTSQSTPCVAGVMALMLEKNPSLSPEDLCRIIETTAANKPSAKNNVIGSGIVDALAAVEATELGEQRPYVRLISFSPKTLVQGGDKQINVTFVNDGKVATENAQYTVSLNNDPYVTLVNDDAIEFGVVNPQATGESSFNVNISSQTPNGHMIYVTTTMTDGDNSWTDNFSVKVTALPNVVYKSCSPSIIRPSDGNVTINVVMQNNGTAASTNDTEITLSTISNNQIIIVDNTSSVGPLGVGETAAAQFVVAAKASATDNYLADMFLETFMASTSETNITYEFEDGLEGWTTFDADKNPITQNAEENIWWHSSEALIHGKVGNNSHSGNGHLMSETVYQSIVEFNYPINTYLVSPSKIKVTENTKVTFYARANHEVYYQQHFGFAISENGNDSESYFTTIKEWHITQQQGTTWTKYTVDLSEYAGKEIYVAIRHFYTDEEWNDLLYGFYADALNIDDITFSNVIMDYHNVPSYSNDDENYFNVVISNPVDLDAPTGLVTSNITTESISLSWDEVDKAQSYNVYRDGEMIANVTATTYTDNNLTHNTEYCYTVAGVHNSNVHEQCEPVCTTTLQKDYSVAIQNVSPETILFDGNDVDLNLTFVNDGKYEHESKSTITLTCDNPYVTLNVSDTGESLKALAAGEVITKTFNITIDNSVPNNHVLRINANVKYIFSPFTSWDLPIDITIKNDPDAPKNLTVSAKTENSVTLTWNAVANAIRYNVYRDDVFVGNTTAASYFDGGLDAATEYTYQVTSVTASGESEKSNEVSVTTNAASEGIVLQSFTMETAIGENIQLTATLINNGSEATPEATTATLSCADPFVTIVDGTADLGSMAAGATAIANFTIKLDEDIPSNYNLNFDVTAEYEGEGGGMTNINYTFDDDLQKCTTMTADNHSWYHSSLQSEHGYNKSYDTGGFVFSESYCNADKDGFDPDHWIVMPEQIVPSDATSFDFYVCSMSSSYRYAGETFGVFVSTTSNTNPNAFVEIDKWTLDKNGNSLEMQLKSIGLYDYEGQKIWVAIRHYGTGDNAALAVDNITIYNVVTPSIITNTSSFSVIANQSLNTFAGTGLWSNATLWSKGIVPTASDDVIINGIATIESGNINVNTLSIEEGSLTINGGVLTVAGLFLNTDTEAFIINDGAQVIQYNDNIAATFNMNIVNWNDANSWQFIASPVKNVKITDFAPATDGYDLFKYDGSKDGTEWVNYQGHVNEFEKTFQQGRGYLASYETETAATFAGILNSAAPFSFEGLSYDSESHYSNFHLLGNPYSFDMEWNNVAAENIYENGFATINVSGSYTYHSGNDVIPAGDGFFVLTRGENPSLSYGTSKNTRSVNDNSINLIASSKMGDDNVIINFTGEETEGFNKLDNFNENIAEIYVGNRYAIMSYDENTTEVEVAFHAKEMGNYTIAAVPTGKFSSIVLTDKFSGNETNLLLEDYHFTATSGDNVNRFIVKVVNGQQSTDNSHFVFQSGEELIVEAEGTVQIIDVMGRVVYSNDVTSDNNRIDVSDYSNGAYVVRVINEKGIKVEKVVIY